MQQNRVIVQYLNPAKNSSLSDGQGSTEDFNSRANTAESKCNSGTNSKTMGPINRLLQSQFWKF